ncbi:MAG: sulfatase/phosphatase domain-containing protein [Dermabacteraceae bacterium]
MQRRRGRDGAIVCEIHGHHVPYPQRMLRTNRYKLVINPESVNEVYDLELDPDELHNRFEHPEMRQLRERLRDSGRARGA